ncbi:MAG: hypothetical protein FJ030_01045 [Chloroflexi bacterium]|nr:hypothetical protein [Chloroflexota bacterium]
MNTHDMYTLAKLAQIKQEEIIDEARNARLYPFDLKAALANRKLAVAASTVIVLATLILFASTM